MGRREERNEEGKKEEAFCLRSKGMGGGEERRGKELGLPRWGFGVAPLFVQIYAHKKIRIVVTKFTLKVAERRKAWPSGRKTYSQKEERIEEHV